MEKNSRLCASASRKKKSGPAESRDMVEWWRRHPAGAIWMVQDKVFSSGDGLS